MYYRKSNSNEYIEYIRIFRERDCTEIEYRCIGFNLATEIEVTRQTPYNFSDVRI